MQDNIARLKALFPDAFTEGRIDFDKNKPVGTKLVFKDSAFADDVAKTNLAAILGQHGLDDVRSI